MSTRIDISAAHKHFGQTDTRMANLLEHATTADPGLAVPTPKPASQYFPTLVRSIVSQQISTAAAATVFARVQHSLSLDPVGIANTKPEDMQELGLSKQKVRYIHALATGWSELQADTFTTSSDSEITKRLTSCYGIGQWTAEMFLLFAMARSDVFAVGDLALRQQVVRHYGGAASDWRAVADRSARWAPHRSAAALALWYELDNGPVLL